MLHFFDYIFYRQYNYIRQHGKGEYWAAWSAFSWTTFVVAMTVLGALSLIGLVAGNDILGKFFALSKFEQYGLIAVFLILLLERWGFKRRYRKALAKFEQINETKRQLMVRNIGIWLYVIAWTGIYIGCQIMFK
ncbi:MAG: hypothetical protein ACRESX_00435 [Gammaproteobacteria bacterium]